MGYKPKVTNASNVNLDVFQLVPSKISNNTISPSFFCANTNAQVAPTFPAPITAIFFFELDINLSLLNLPR